MDTLTTEQFGASVRLKYPEYAKYSNKEIAKRMLAKFPQYAEKISDLEKPKEKSLFRKVGDFFTSSTQKLGTTLGQVRASESVLEGLPETESRLTDTEIQLRRRITENKTLGKDTTKLEQELNTFTGREKTGDIISDVVPSIEKSNKRVLGEIVGTSAEALSGGILSGIRGIGLSRIAPNAITQAAQKAQFLAKPLSGRLAEIGVNTAKNASQAIPFGYAIDVARNLEEDKSGASVFKPGMGTLFSALIPASIGGIQASRQLASTALSRGVAPNLSGVPSGAYERMRTGNATKYIGKVTPESALDDARATASAFKSTMQKEFGEGRQEIITEFTGKRIGLSERTGAKIQRIATAFGFEDRLPQNMQDLSAKEAMDLLSEMNAKKRGVITALDTPLARSLKLNLGEVRDELMALATKEFGGKGGSFSRIYNNYSSKSRILKDIQSIVGKVGRNPNSMKLTPVQHQTATRRLQKVFNDDAEGFLNVVRELGDEVGDNLLDKIAASQLSPRLPKSFRVSMSAVPAFNMATTGGLGLLNDVVSAVTIPLSSPRVGAWVIRKVGGYDPSVVTKLLNAVPSVRNAIYKAVHKDNMAFNDAVELYAKDYLKNPKLGLSMQDVSGGAQNKLNNNAASGNTTQISTKNTTTAPITSSIDSKVAPSKGIVNRIKDFASKLKPKETGRKYYATGEFKTVSPKYEVQVQRLVEKMAENGDALARNFPDRVADRLRNELRDQSVRLKQTSLNETRRHQIYQKTFDDKFKALETASPNNLNRPEFKPIRDLTPAKDLSPDERVLEQKAFDKLRRDPQKAIDEYNALEETKKGLIANGDFAKKVYIKEGYNGINSRAFQKVASALGKVIYRIGLKRPGQVIAYAGGSGTGKTSAIKLMFPDKIKNAGVILDGNFSKFDDSMARIKEAHDVGKDINVVFAEREPIDSWVNGVIKRMFTEVDEMERVVPASVVAENTIGAYDVTRRILALSIKGEFKKGKVTFDFVKNSLGYAKQVEMSIDEFLTLKYPTQEEYVKMLRAETKKIYEAGSIEFDGKTYQMTKEQYEALIQ